MLALVLPIDHRLALVALIALLIAAAIPLAYAWATLIPDEPPPFPIEPGSFPIIDHEPAPVQPSAPKRDLVIAVTLLSCLTLAYLTRFPGFPNALLLGWVNELVSAPTAYWTIAARVSVLVFAGAACLYAALRPTPLRIPLATAAALVLLLWFLSPLLKATLLRTP